MPSDASIKSVIHAEWDDEASVWIATSDDIVGLVIEADTLSYVRKEIDLILPDLLELNGQSLTLTNYVIECSTLSTPLR